MQVVVCAYCRQEVHAHVYCARCGAPLTSRTQKLEGKRLYSYQIEECIGEGASGRLYKAKHIATEQYVALKLLQPKLTTNPKSIRRFRREAEVGIRLQHPHAVKLFEFGIHPMMGLFTVTELIVGTSLQALLKEHTRLSPERAIRIALQLCEVLEKAHSLQIIHRDLKPANVLLQWHSGHEDYAKVCDFGLAKMQAIQIDETHLTVPGTICGTPGYMSPEQCLGEEAGRASDIYSLGITLYHMLTGCLPFAASTPLELLMRPLQSAPLLLRKANTELHKYPKLDFLEEAVMRCIQRSPQVRYPDIHTLKLDLQMSLLTPTPTERDLRPMAWNTTPSPPTAFPWEPVRLTHEQLDNCRNLVRTAPVQSFLPSQTVYQKEQFPTRFFLIRSGYVRIVAQNEDHVIELDRLGPGDFVGVGSFFSNSPYNWTAEAISEAELHIIERTFFTVWIQEDARLQALFHHFFHEFLLQEVIRYTTFFNLIPLVERKEIILSTTLHPVGRGQSIREQGEYSQGLYIIASGQVELYDPQPQGKHIWEHIRLSAGDMFGELSLLGNQPMPLSARTLSNAIILHIPLEKLYALAHTYPAIHGLLRQTAEQRIQEYGLSSLHEHRDTIPI